jgi:hypothetical protein
VKIKICGSLTKIIILLNWLVVPSLDSLLEEHKENRVHIITVIHNPMKTIGKMVLPSVGIQLSSSFPIHKTLRRTPIHLKPPLSNSITNNMSSSSSFPKNTTNRKLPILLFDIMDTIVRDPFYKDIPAFFQMSFNQLIDSKHPTAWIEFEKGLIDEVKIKKLTYINSMQN